MAEDSKAKSEEEFINVCLFDLKNQKELKVKMTAPLEDLMNEYCTIGDILRVNVLFIFNGRIIDGSKTAQQLKIKEGNRIVVVPARKNYSN